MIPDFPNNIRIRLVGAETANRAETEQLQDATKYNFNPTNLIPVL